MTSKEITLKVSTTSYKKNVIDNMELMYEQEIKRKIEQTNLLIFSSSIS